MKNRTKSDSSKRGPGRPHHRDRPVTPEVLFDINHRDLQGQSLRRIARTIGVSKSTVEHHLKHTIIPLYRNAPRIESVAVGYSQIAKLIGHFGAEIPVGTSAIDRILAAELSAVEKIILIALCRRPPDADVTGTELAAAASVHRVTVVKTLTALRARGLLRQLGPQRWQVVWSVLKGDSPLGKPAADWRDNDRMLRAARQFTPRSTRRRA